MITRYFIKRKNRLSNHERKRKEADEGKFFNTHYGGQPVRRNYTVKPSTPNHLGPSEEEK